MYTKCETDRHIRNSDTSEHDMACLDKPETHSHLPEGAIYDLFGTTDFISDKIKGENSTSRLSWDGIQGVPGNSLIPNFSCQVSLLNQRCKGT